MSGKLQKFHVSCEEETNPEIMNVMITKSESRPSATRPFSAAAPRPIVPTLRKCLPLLAAFMAWYAAPQSAQGNQWTGAVDSDWFEAGNWSLAVPNSGQSADISADGPVLLTGGTASWLTLRLSGNQSLTVLGGAQVSGVALLVGDGSAAGMLLTGTDTVLSLSSGRTPFGIGSSSAMTISDGALLSTVTTDDSFLPVIFQAGAGTLNLNSGGILAAARLGSAAPAGTKINFDGGVLRSLGNTSNLFAGFQAGNVELLAGGGTFDTNGFDATAGNAIGGSGGLTKSGAGTLTLGGANDYSGSTTVSVGTLQLGATGSISSTSGIDIASGSTFDVSALAGGFTLGASQSLSGNGTILGNVTTAGTLSPGNSTGALQITGDLLLDSAAIIEMEIATLSDFDRILVDSMLTYGGTLTLSFLDGYLPAIGDTFELFQDFSSHSGTFADIVFPSSDYAADFDYGTGQLTFTAIPEPNTFVFLALSGLVTAFGRHRRLLSR